MIYKIQTQMWECKKVLWLIIYSIYNIWWMLNLGVCNRKVRFCGNKNFCNNLVTRVIPFFIVLKSSIDETILKLSYHSFLRTPLPRYQWRHIWRSRQKLYFQTSISCLSLGCFFCTNQFLINQFEFKMQENNVLCQIQNVMTV